MGKFAELKQIPFTILQRRVNDKQPMAIHAHAGKPALISTEDGQFVMDVLRRRDRANDVVVGIAGALEMFEQLRPDLSRSQITNAFAHTIRPKYKEELTNLRVTLGVSCLHIYFYFQSLFDYLFSLSLLLLWRLSHRLRLASSILNSIPTRS